MTNKSSNDFNSDEMNAIIFALENFIELCDEVDHDPDVEISDKIESQMFSKNAQSALNKIENMLRFEGEPKRSSL